MAGYASSQSAGNAWRPLKNKIFGTTTGDGAAPATPKKKRAAKPKKAAQNENADDDDDENHANTPGPTPKRTPKRKAADGEDGASPKKRGRKPAVKKQESKREKGENDGTSFFLLSVSGSQLT